jgi:hypothetical protein
MIDDAIKLKTESDRPQYEKDHGINVSHSSLLIRFPLYQGLEDRMWTTEAVGDGTVLHLLSNDLSGFNGQLWWYPLKDDIGTDAFRRSVGTLAFEYIGLPYDYTGLFEELITNVTVQTKKLFCSMYVQLVYFGQKAIGQKALVPNNVPTLGIFKEPVLIFNNPMPYVPGADIVSPPPNTGS